MVLFVLKCHLKAKNEIFAQILDSVRQMRKSCKPPSRVMWLSDVYFGLSENIPGRNDVNGPSIINAIKVTIISDQTNTNIEHTFAIVISTCTLIELQMFGGRNWNSSSAIVKLFKPEVISTDFSFRIVQN